MTDVLKIALDRRAELHDEVARIDDFIRMADMLLRRLPRGEQVEDDKGLMARDLSPAREPQGAVREQPAGDPREVTTGVTRMNLMRRGPAAVNG